MTPFNFSKAVVKSGTTTVITDPHEISNVLGIKGFKYMYNNSSNAYMRVLFDIPSSIPAAGSYFETSGAEFTGETINELAKLERVVGLGEIMNVPGVVNGDKKVLGVISAANKNNLYLQGHAPAVSKRELAAYLIAGGRTDHETTTSENAIEKVRNGMYIDMRNGSTANDVLNIYKDLKDIKFFDRFTLCTDDKEADDILDYGHINSIINLLTKNGLDPIEAIKCATLNAANEANLKYIGAIAPGFIADFVIFDNLKDINPTDVFVQGNQIVKNSKVSEDKKSLNLPIDKYNSVKIKKSFTVKDFEVKVKEKVSQVKVNTIVKETNSILTKKSVETVLVKNGIIDISNNNDLAFIAIINRHTVKNNFSVGVIKNYGLKKGAISSTIAHDSHNLSIIYKNPVDALKCLKQIKKQKGGICASLNGKIIGKLELPVAGLMSNLSAENLAKKSQEMKNKIFSLGLPKNDNPLLRAVFLSLIVIPEIKITDKGIVENFKFIDLINKKVHS
jgi:adenine deaminase